MGIILKIILVECFVSGFHKETNILIKYNDINSEHTVLSLNTKFDSTFFHKTKNFDAKTPDIDCEKLEELFYSKLPNRFY